MIYDAKTHGWQMARWSRLQSGDDHYIDEQTQDDGPITRFGPMPVEFVEPLLAERQEFFRSMVRALIRGIS